MPSTSLADVDAWSSMAEKSASFGALPNVPLNLVSVATLTLSLIHI